MNRILKNILSYVAEHVIKIVLASLFTIAGGWLLFSQDYAKIIFTFLLERESLIILALTIFSIALLAFKPLKSKTHGESYEHIEVSYRDINLDEHPFEYSGMKWVAYTPTQFPYANDETVYVNGPFCRLCNFKLTFLNQIGLRKFWRCNECKLKFRTIKGSPNQDKEHIRELVFSKKFTGQKFVG